MVQYKRYRKLTSADEAFWSYYKIFAFILVMLASQIISLSDAYFNYSIDVQKWLLALPNVFNFVWISYAISNL